MWNLVFGNKACNKFNRFKDHRGHLERISQAKPMIDDSAPDQPKFLTSRVRGESKKIGKRETMRKINYENNVLFAKMREISTKPSPYSISQNIPTYAAAFDKENQQYHKRKKLKDIDETNKKLFKRFQNAKSAINTRKFIEENEYNKYLEENINKGKYNPNLDFATYRQFKKNLTIAIEREIVPININGKININPYDFNNKANYSQICEADNNFNTINNNYYRSLSGKSRYNNRIYKNKPYSAKTRVTITTKTNSGS